MFIRQDGPNLEVLAPAKLNLFLEVTGKRSDGFHELDMLMVPVALFDTLKVSLLDNSDIQLLARWAHGLPGHPEIPSAEDNLVHHALCLFQETVFKLKQQRPGLCVQLTKRIPAAAGLGGASSDAAAALVAANQLLDTILTTEQLLEVAAAVGSDVPFFLFRSPARCQGRGEVVTPVTAGKRIPLVLVKPEQGLSTPAVFDRLADIGWQAPHSIEPMLTAFEKGDLACIAKSLHNRLLKPAVALLPELKELSGQLAELNMPGYQMTGSGSTFFVICRHQNQAKKLASRLRQMKLGTVIDTYTLNQPFGWAA